MADGEWHEGWDAELAAFEAIIAADPAIAALPLSDLVKANPQLDSVPRFGSPMFADLKTSLRGISPDFAFDPIPVLERLTCPVLIVLAEHDANVPIAASQPRFEALARARPGSVEVRVLPGADHRFSSPEYAARTSGQTVHPPRKAIDYRPDFLGPVAGWVSRLS
jgi:pimeloyl-ACP methyl ester carboxylesterase